jgi:hypothetical protein
MKSLSCACIALMLFVNVSAQSLFTKASSGFSKAPTGFAKALQTILLDYPNNFHGINGELLISQGEYEHYASTVTIPGAESCVIGRYHSYADTTASFQAVLYRTDNFEEASKQYRSLFKQLKSSPITLIDGSKYYLNGEMGKLDESLDFTVSTMVFPHADRRYYDFKVELELLYQMHEWVINLNMGKRKKDDQQ